MTDNLLKVVQKGTLGEQQIRSIFYFHWLDPFGVNDKYAIIDDYLDAFWDPIISALSTRLSYTAYDCYIRTGTEWVLEQTQPYNKAGTSATDTLPNQSAAVLVGKVGGWRGFGRKFIGGIQEGNQSSGQLANDFLLLLADSVVAYISDGGGGGVNLLPGIFSRDGVFRNFVEGIVDGLVGSQRRRKPGVGQ